MVWRDWLVNDSPNRDQARRGRAQPAQHAGRCAQAAHRPRSTSSSAPLTDEPQTLEDLSAKYGISRERVRQIGSAPSTSRRRR